MSWRNRAGRPAFVDQDVGLRAGGVQRLLTSGVATSAATAITLAPVALAISSAVD